MLLVLLLLFLLSRCFFIFQERKSFDEKFIRIDTKRLCELTSAADSLQLKPLVDLTSRALARMIEGKTPEEIRETFHLPDDLTEVFSKCFQFTALETVFIISFCFLLYTQEEKLEPLKNANDDPRIRLLNRLYAKKRKELKERQKLKVGTLYCNCSDFVSSCSKYGIHPQS